MKLIEAVRNKNKKAVLAIVAKAVKTYTSTEPAPIEVNTVYGEMDIRMLDRKSKWQMATSELVKIRQLTKCIGKDADKKVETAKIIAESQLRILFDEPEDDGYFL